MKKIQLTKGKTAVVDDRDYERVSKISWYAQSLRDRWYAASAHNGKHTFMHRFILNAPDGVDVDHKDRDGLNNIRKNLRLATRSQNNANSRIRKDNTSGHKGITKHGPSWRIEITFNGERIRKSGYKTLEAALIARRKIAKEIFGEFYREE